MVLFKCDREQDTLVIRLIPRNQQNEASARVYRKKRVVRSINKTSSVNNSLSLSYPHPYPGHFVRSVKCCNLRNVEHWTFPIFSTVCAQEVDFFSSTRSLQLKNYKFDYVTADAIEMGTSNISKHTSHTTIISSIYLSLKKT